MKTKVLLVLTTLLTMSLYGQRGVRIGYIDMEYILENVSEYQEANTQLSGKVQKWKDEIEKQQAAIDKMRKELLAEKVLLTRELILEREEEITILEKDLQTYQENRFGPQGDLFQQRRLLAQPVQDQVFNAIQEIAASRGYDFVFDKSADLVMLYSDKRHDISDLVLRSINRAATQNARKGPNEIDKFDQEPELTPEAIARKEAIDAKRAEQLEKTEERKAEIAKIQEERLKEVEDRRTEQTKALEEKRQKLLEEREKRKKEYEEKRQKLIEEREAKRKKAWEEREKKKDTTETKEN